MQLAVENDQKFNFIMQISNFCSKEMRFTEWIDARSYNKSA